MDVDDATIQGADLETVYDLLKIFALDDNLSKAEKSYLDGAISQVKNGIGTEFNVMYIFTDNMDEDEKNQVVIVPNCRTGRIIPMDVFADELEERKILGKKVLLDLNHEEGFFRGNQE